VGGVEVGVFVNVPVDGVAVGLRLPGVTVLRVRVCVFAQLKVMVEESERKAVKVGVLVGGLAVRVHVGGEGVQVKI